MGVADPYRRAHGNLDNVLVGTYPSGAPSPAVLDVRAQVRSALVAGREVV
jgi:hypothetical protein